MKSITFDSSSAQLVGKLVRMLASDKDGDVINTARALNRTLVRNGADLHHLADVVEHGLQHPVLPPPPPPPDPLDEIHEELTFCLQWLDVFNDYEAKFIKQMQFFEQRDGGDFDMSPKQRLFLEGLFRKARRATAQRA